MADEQVQTEETPAVEAVETGQEVEVSAEETPVGDDASQDLESEAETEELSEVETLRAQLAEAQQAKALLDLLKGPQAELALETLAKQRGLTLSKAGQADKTETPKTDNTLDAVKARLSKVLGNTAPSLVDPLAESITTAIQDALNAQMAPINQRTEANNIQAAAESLSGKFNDFMSLGPQITQVVENELPFPDTSSPRAVAKHLERVYRLVKLEQGESDIVAQTAQRITKNSKRHTKAPSSPSGAKEPAKKLSLEEALQEAMSEAGL